MEGTEYCACRAASGAAAEQGAQHAPDSDAGATARRRWLQRLADWRHECRHAPGRPARRRGWRACPTAMLGHGLLHLCCVPQSPYATHAGVRILFRSVARGAVTNGVHVFQGTDWWAVPLEVPADAYEMHAAFSDGGNIWDKYEHKRT